MGRRLLLTIITDISQKEGLEQAKQGHEGRSKIEEDQNNYGGWVTSVEWSHQYPFGKKKMDLKMEPWVGHMTIEPQLIVKRGCFAAFHDFQKHFRPSEDLFLILQTIFSLALSLVHWVLIWSGQVRKEEEKKIDIVRENRIKAFNGSRRQYRTSISMVIKPWVRENKGQGHITSHRCLI